MAKEPGVRVPRAVDGFEMAVRAVVGQQISVAGARTTLARLAAALNPVPVDDSPDDGEAPLTGFPDPATVAAAPDEVFGMPAARRTTIRTLAGAVASGDLVLDEGADRAETEAALRRIPGIGAWTAGYVAIRALGDPDVALATDLGVRRGAGRLGLPDSVAGLEDHARRWRPWRSYAAIRLWRA
jgi:AraC family transcriptional regulator of adaptative response / DNA-3-methyladenine glycosylase II